MSVKKGSLSAHQHLLSEILLKYGTDTRYRLWSNNTGVVFVKGRKISFGLKGSADIIGIRKTDGKFIAIEVKTGEAKQTKEQLNFEKMIRKFGGIYVVARTPDIPELSP